MTHSEILTPEVGSRIIGHKGRRWYLAPGEPVPISRWEYTRPDLVAATIALGDREALRREGELTEFLDGG